MDTHHPYRTGSPQETQALGEKLAIDLITQKKTGTIVVCLYGELGSGKTTFTQGFAKGLNITGRILSPTFTFVRQYNLQSGKKLFHLDLYRTSADDPSINIQELLEDTNAILLIEWADRMKRLLPEKRIDIFFKTNDDDTHTITIKPILLSS